MNTLDNVQQEVSTLTERCGYAAAAVTLLPLPGSELIAVMPIHVGMVVRIGDLYGVTLDRESAMHLILRIGATVGLSLFGSRVAMTVAKVVLPGLGGLVAAPMMYASTLGIGAVAQAYFAGGGSLTNADMRSIYNRTSKKAKKGFDPKKARATEAREAAARAREEEQHTSPAERLARIKSLFEKGLISADDFEQAKAEILTEL